MDITARRVLLVGLDGYDPEIGASLIADGRLPTLARLLQQGLRFDLEHGAARRTGLGWEHMATGLTPEDAGRYASVSLDTRSYDVRQWPTASLPFTAGVDGVPILVFNAPYFDLGASPNTQGIVGWGVHDPGITTGAQPAALLTEAKALFGDYPASRWTYALSWPSAERTRRMAEALVAGVEHGTRVARWLFAERVPDWRLGYFVCSELHTADEAMIHGWLADHPLANHPSAMAARSGLASLYEALDRCVATLEAALPGVTLVLTVPHGMGVNVADVPGMLLLAELMHREFAGRAVFRAGSFWQGSEPPVLPDGVFDWSHEIRLRCRFPRSVRRWRRTQRARFSRSAMGRRLGFADDDAIRDGWAIEWMPCTWYRDSWRKMDAFAMPAYYDAQARVNLAGREAQGRVALSDYGNVLDRIERMLAECTDWHSGEPVRFQAHRREIADPRKLSPTDCDLMFEFADCSLGWRHPRHGLIGPAPMRRTGGHTGGHGLLLIVGPGIEARHAGLASAFDVQPTVLELLGCPVPSRLSGRPLSLQPAA